MFNLRRGTRTSPMRRAGVTLAELLVVVVVMGILAAVGVPGYRKALERAYLREAKDILMTIYSGQRAYFFLNGFYKTDPGSDNNQWRMMHMDNPNVTAAIPVDFSISRPTPTTFTATGTRLGGGVCLNDTATINDQRAEGGTWQACVDGM